MRLVEKTKLSEDGQPTRLKRRYGQAKTPCDRLIATAMLEPAQIAQMIQLRQETNPRRLRKQIYDMIRYIFSLPAAVP
jgi:hypothetical protein